MKKKLLLQKTIQIIDLLIPEMNQLKKELELATRTLHPDNETIPVERAVLLLVQVIKTLEGKMALSALLGEIVDFIEPNNKIFPKSEDKFIDEIQEKIAKKFHL